MALGHLTRALLPGKLGVQAKPLRSARRFLLACAESKPICALGVSVCRVHRSHRNYRRWMSLGCSHEPLGSFSSPVPCAARRTHSIRISGRRSRGARIPKASQVIPVCSKAETTPGAESPGSEALLTLRPADTHCGGAGSSSCSWKTRAWLPLTHAWFYHRKAPGMLVSPPAESAARYLLLPKHKGYFCKCCAVCDQTVLESSSHSRTCLVLRGQQSPDTLP